MGFFRDDYLHSGYTSITSMPPLPARRYQRPSESLPSFSDSLDACKPLHTPISVEDDRFPSSVARVCRCDEGFSFCPTPSRSPSYTENEHRSLSVAEPYVASVLPYSPPTLPCSSRCVCRSPLAIRVYVRHPTQHDPSCRRNKRQSDCLRRNSFPSCTRSPTSRRLELLRCWGENSTSSSWSVSACFPASRV